MPFSETPRAVVVGDIDETRVDTNPASAVCQPKNGERELLD
jgi:hypothetical protein